MNAPYILWLGEPTAHDAALVGGKVANLSRLTGAYPVPEGFCLTVAAYERAHQGHMLTQLDQALRHAYGVLAAQNYDLRVAVRSSAADEDGEHDSFAGQHETYLNVQGASAVADAIRRCWASAHTSQALAYRQQRGLSWQRIRLAVLVQRLVPADVSVVAFSANPMSGARNEVVINASWGLGESIVGGLVTPDMLVVGKATNTVRSRLIADKRRMTVAVPGGTHEVDVPRLLRTRPALTDEQIVEVAALASSLEQRVGYPVDIECAYHGSTLYLLQCRPITTLAQTLKAHEGAE